MKRPKPDAWKGRGAASNPDCRYEPFRRQLFDDGWGSLEQEPPPLKTSLEEDKSRRMIVFNDSPDVPFDRSINPYRGCEHGWSISGSALWNLIAWIAAVLSDHRWIPANCRFLILVDRSGLANSVQAYDCLLTNYLRTVHHPSGYPQAVTCLQNQGPALHAHPEAAAQYAVNLIHAV